jgi:hypothetical protein
MSGMTPSAHDAQHGERFFALEQSDETLTARDTAFWTPGGAGAEEDWTAPSAANVWQQQQQQDERKLPRAGALADPQTVRGAAHEGGRSALAAQPFRARPVAAPTVEIPRRLGTAADGASLFSSASWLASSMTDQAAPLGLHHHHAHAHAAAALSSLAAVPPPDAETVPVSLTFAPVSARSVFDERAHLSSTTRSWHQQRQGAPGGW